MAAARPTAVSVSFASFDRIMRAWQSTLLFFWPDISSGISKTISTSALSGSCSEPWNRTPDWLIFSMIPSAQVPRFLTRYRTGVSNFNLRARGTQVGFLVWARRLVAGSPDDAPASTRPIRRMVFQSYLYSAAHNRQIW